MLRDKLILFNTLSKNPIETLLRKKKDKNLSAQKKKITKHVDGQAHPLQHPI